MKLFDFGLAKELDPRQKNDDGLYNMSGGTGSRRKSKSVVVTISFGADNIVFSGFMAPEVSLSEPYTLSADIYSFAILFWEMLTYEKAFGRMPSDDHRVRVVKKGERPKLDRQWSETLVRLLDACWAPNQANRPKAKEVYKTLKEEILDTYEKEFSGVVPD